MNLNENFSGGKLEIANKGRTYTDFRKTLTPKYYIVYRDIFFAYCAFFIIGYLLAVINNIGLSPLQMIILIGLGGCLFGISIQYLMLFFHESTHYNIASNKRVNDFLSNMLMGLIIGEDIKTYRRIHFGHHKYLGTTKDPENSYFFKLNWKSVIHSLTGLRLLNVITSRKKWLKESRKSELNKKKIIMLIGGVIYNLGILYSLYLFNYWIISISWMLGVLSIYPFLNCLRQTLEHRSERAEGIDYTKINHSPVNRLFRVNIASSIFGGAGFNRHLLHHWDPQISYTRLKDVQEFIMASTKCTELRQFQTTYSKTLIKIFNDNKSSKR